MSLKKMIVSGAAALALMGTAAAAANVVLEQDGTGDYLLAPVYYAVSNWSTTLKVVNTNTTRAIVAKVVLRDSKQCDEIIDFPLYLTPGDVWEGTIKEDENGNIVVVTKDDSVILGGKSANQYPNGLTISPTPAHKKVETNANGCTRVNWHGYVEIFGVASYDPKEIDSAWEPCKPLSKIAFYNAVAKNSAPNLSTGYGFGDVANSDLMGKITIYAESANVNGRRTMMLNMLALGNVSETGVSTNVIGADTRIANMSSKGLDVIPEIDAALAKQSIYVMYEGDGNSLYPIRTHFTVPTKKYWFDEVKAMPNAYQLPKGVTTAKCGSEYYYALNSTGNEITFRDMEENCNKCKKKTEISGGQEESCEIKIHEEVHFFGDKDMSAGAKSALGITYDVGAPIRDYAFAQGGYIDFNLTNNDYTYNGGKTKEISFAGMPIVPTTFYAKDVQGIYLNNWLYNQYEKPGKITLK